MNQDQNKAEKENTNSPDVTQQDSEAIRKLKHDISINIKKAFLNPPDLKSFEKCFPENRLISKENLEQIAASLYFHSFKTDENHLQLLREVKLDALDFEDKMHFHQLMFSVYEKNQEYTLALYESEKALELANKLNDANLIFHSMTAKGSMLIRLESPGIENYHRKIIEFAEKNKLEDQLSWAYHNWGSYKWSQGDKQGAIYLFEKEKPLREKEGPESLFSYFGFLTETLDSENPKVVFDLFKEMLRLIDSNTNITSKQIVGETKYRATVVGLRFTDNLDELLPIAIDSYEIFNQLSGMESRAAWAAGLLEIIYEKLKNPENAMKYKEIKMKFINEYGSDPEKLRKDLSDLANSTNASDEDFKSLESYTNEPGREEAYIDWSLVYSLYLYKKGRFQEALDLIEYTIQLAEGLTKFSINFKKDFTLSLIYQQKAELLLATNRLKESEDALEKAVKFTPNNYDLRWRLCNNSYAGKNYNLAKENALFLIESGIKYPGPYRILAKVLSSKGDFDSAFKVLVKAKTEFSNHKEISEEYEELNKIKLGLLKPKDSKFFQDLTEPIGSKTLVHSDPIGFYEQKGLSIFQKGLIEATFQYTYQLQKTPPVFLDSFRNHKVSLNESHFRDEMERQLSHLYSNSGAEVKHGLGKTDLIVKDPNASIPNGVIFEFKVWGRNDYASVVAQIAKYMSDFQTMGIVFMINENKSSIANKYEKLIIFGDPNYKTGSFRRPPVTKETNLEHFYSEHKTPYNKTIKIFNFIFNAF